MKESKRQKVSGHHISLRAEMEEKGRPWRRNLAGRLLRTESRRRPDCRPDRQCRTWVKVEHKARNQRRGEERRGEAEYHTVSMFRSRKHVEDIKLYCCSWCTAVLLASMNLLFVTMKKVASVRPGVRSKLRYMFLSQITEEAT